MAGNVQPQFTTNGNISSVAVTAGNTSSEGGGTIGGGSPTIFVAFTAGANGSFVESLLWMPTASVAATNTQATVGRVFISSVSSGSTTSANTYLIAEVILPAAAADNSAAAMYGVEIPIQRRLPANWTILVTNHQGPNANTQWIATCFGGDY